MIDFVPLSKSDSQAYIQPQACEAVYAVYAVLCILTALYRRLAALNSSVETVTVEHIGISLGRQRALAALLR
jgi:hypothetical protein